MSFTIHELTPDECRTVLGRNNLARLACSKDDQPYIVPILCYFDADGDALYSIAAAGQKIAWMRENPKVSVEVSEIGDRYHWTSVVAFGRYEELTDSVADADLRRRAHELFDQRHEWWFPAMQKPDPNDTARTVVYRIRIDEMTGRRASRDRE